MRPSAHSEETGVQHEVAEEAATAVDWVVRFRWAAVAGQVAMLAAVEFGMHISVGPAAVGIVAAGLVSNFLLRRVCRRLQSIPSWAPGAVLLLDIALLTGLLAFTGGATNPFSFLYVVYIAVAAVVARGWAVWAVILASLLGYGALFAGGIDAGGSGHEVGASMRAHLYGMWGAMAVTAVLIGRFVTMIWAAFRERGHRLRRMERRQADQRRLASLATMAAGAAHELSTPLGSIAISSKELERELREAGDELLAEEAAVIRQQVDRCRDILDRMSADSGERRGEPIRECELAALVETAVADVEAERVDFRSGGQTGGQTHGQTGGPRVRVAPRAFREVVASVIQNALEASGADARVKVKVTVGCDSSEGAAFVRVTDAGGGMSPEVLRRATEPFFSTKEPGEGMGLGLFVARQTLAQLGGRLSLESEEGMGTTVTMTLPLIEETDVE